MSRTKWFIVALISLNLLPSLALGEGTKAYLRLKNKETNTIRVVEGSSCWRSEHVYAIQTSEGLQAFPADNNNIANNEEYVETQNCTQSSKVPVQNIDLTVSVPKNRIVTETKTVKDNVKYEIADITGEVFYKRHWPALDSYYRMVILKDGSAHEIERDHFGGITEVPNYEKINSWIQTKRNTMQAYAERELTDPAFAPEKHQIEAALDLLGAMVNKVQLARTQGLDESSIMTLAQNAMHEYNSAGQSVTAKKSRVAMYPGYSGGMPTAYPGASPSPLPMLNPLGTVTSLGKYVTYTLKKGDGTRAKLIGYEPKDPNDKFWIASNAEQNHLAVFPRNDYQWVDGKAEIPSASKSSTTAEDVFESVPKIKIYQGENWFKPGGLVFKDGSLFGLEGKYAHTRIKARASATAHEQDWTHPYGKEYIFFLNQNGEVLSFDNGTFMDNFKEERDGVDFVKLKVAAEHKVAEIVRNKAFLDNQTRAFGRAFPNTQSQLDAALAKFKQIVDLANNADTAQENKNFNMGNDLSAYAEIKGLADAAKIYIEDATRWSKAEYVPAPGLQFGVAVAATGINPVAGTAVPGMPGGIPGSAHTQPWVNSGANPNCLPSGTGSQVVPAGSENLMKSLMDKITGVSSSSAKASGSSDGSGSVISSITLDEIRNDLQKAKTKAQIDAVANKLLAYGQNDLASDFDEEAIVDLAKNIASRYGDVTDTGSRRGSDRNDKTASSFLKRVSALRTLNQSNKNELAKADRDLQADKLTDLADSGDSKRFMRKYSSFRTKLQRDAERAQMRGDYDEAQEIASTARSLDREAAIMHRRPLYPAASALGSGALPPWAMVGMGTPLF